MRAREILSNMVIPLKPTDTVSLALGWMEDMSITHLPIVNKGKLVGVVPHAALFEMNDDADLSENKGLPLVRSYVYADQHFLEVLQIAAAEKLSLVPVLDTHDHYLGSVTQWEIIKAMAAFTASSQPGGIIVLEINEQSYSLSEIARIVEANDAKVLSASISSEPDCTQLEVTIKVNVIDLSAIIQTLNRYDYIIKASFSNESHYDSMLNERFDSLMKYLNI